MLTTTSHVCLRCATCTLRRVVHVNHTTRHDSNEFLRLLALFAFASECACCHTMWRPQRVLARAPRTDCGSAADNDIDKYTHTHGFVERATARELKLVCNVCYACLISAQHLCVCVRSRGLPTYLYSEMSAGYLRDSASCPDPGQSWANCVCQ